MDHMNDSRPTPPLDNAAAAAALHLLGVPASAPSLPLLHRLQAAYVRRVSWESASRIVRRAAGPTADACPCWPAQFWAEAARQGHGGTCFESNYAFMALLLRLGYTGYLTINDMGDQRACHTAIVVRLDGQAWLVDVGLPLLAPLPLDGTRRARSRLQDYEALDAGRDRLRIMRAPHPRPEAFQLVNRPVADADYRRALTADYGPDGLFLDRVVVSRLIAGRLWRFNSGERPFRLEAFARDQSDHYDIHGDPAPIVARRFGMDAGTLRTALALVA